jgi:hypothetical protein
MSGSVPEAHRQWSRSVRVLRVLGFALLSCGLMSGAFAYAEPAAEGPTAGAMQVVGGQLAWGFTQTFQGQPQSAWPSIAVGAGATQERDGTIDFPAAGGSYDSASGTATMRYRGTVALTYPAGRVTVTNPTVVIDRTGTALRADLDATASQAQDPAMRTERLTQADMGDMQMSGIAPQTAARTLTWSEVPTMLTATGATAFPDSFEGAFLGPVTFAATLAAPSEPQANQAPAAQAPNAPSATSPFPNFPAPDFPAPNARPNAAATTSTATPGASDCPSPSASVSGTASTTPSPTGTTPTGPTATTCPTSDDQAGPQSNGPSGPADKLAKTGGPLAPLALFGVVLTVAGAGTMMSARRRTLAGPH